MTIRRKLLIAFGSFIGLTAVMGATAPAPAQPGITPSTVLSAEATATPTQSPLITAAPTPAPTAIPTPVPTPRPTVAPASSGSGYTNSDGNHVASPVQADSPPAGATAQCVDGTYSFSQHRSGTCSHHGGVARWL
jgi:hypothetical protein